LLKFFFGIRDLHVFWLRLMLVLGIETSCDETAAAIVRDGRILSNVVSSQVSLHSEYGGVVPELATREHLRNFLPVAHSALAEAKIEPRDIGAVAATQGPGLPNALLVGFKAAQALAYALGKPCLGINHHEAHLYSPWIRGDTADFSAFEPNVSVLKWHGLHKVRTFEGSITRSGASQTGTI